MLLDKANSFLSQNDGVCMIGSVFHNEGNQQDIENATLWVDDGMKLKLLKNVDLSLLDYSFFQTHYSRN